MEISKILKSDYLDILFEGRNKKYGSYELRKKYPNRARNAAIIMAVGIVLIGAVPILASILKGKAPPPPPVSVKEVVLAEPPPIDKTKPPPPPPPPAPPPPVKPTVKFTPPVVLKDEEVKEDEKPVEVKELKDQAVGLETKAGDIHGIDPGLVAESGPPGGTGVEAPAAPAIFKFVEQMPAFNGDLNAYLAAQLRYPDDARENGNEGRAVVQFIVNENGAISGVEVVRKSGFPSLDAEAIRVVSRMPPWKPGKQQGKEVKVYFTLPVTFKLD